MVTLGIIFLALALVILIAICAAMAEHAPIILMAFLLGMIALLGALFISEGTRPEKKEFKYPTTEYTLEYEVITRGEQIDSVYVISKIE